MVCVLLSISHCCHSIVKGILYQSISWSDSDGVYLCKHVFATWFVLAMHTCITQLASNNYVSAFESQLNSL